MIGKVLRRWFQRNDHQFIIATLTAENERLRDEVAYLRDELQAVGRRSLEAVRKGGAR